MDGIPESISMQDFMIFVMKFPLFAYSERKIAPQSPVGTAIRRLRNKIISVEIIDGNIVCAPL